MMIPSDTTARVGLLSEIKKTKIALSMDVQLEDTEHKSLFYVLPCPTCTSCLTIEFAAICVTPMTQLLSLGVNTGASGGPGGGPSNDNSNLVMLHPSMHGLKALENKLELLVLSHNDPNTNIPR